MELQYMVPQGCPTVTPSKCPDHYSPQGDFSLLLVGTGCPETALGRSSLSAVLQYKGNYFMVDVGETTNTRLAQGGIPSQKIPHLFFTSPSGDYTAGYPYFAIDSWMKGRKTLDLVGCEKIETLHKLLLEFYHDDLQYRAARQGNPVDGIYHAKFHTLTEETTLNFDGVTVTAIPSEENPSIFGYRFEVEGKVIAVATHPDYGSALSALAKDCHILLTAPNKDLPSLAKSCGVKSIILCNSPQDLSSAYQQEGLEVVMGRDLTEYLPE